ncbi:MAG: cytochrome c3 family protein, partial [Pseudomonadota bacterium]
AVQGGQQVASKVIVMTKEQRADIARKLLEVRQPVRETYNTEDIPEKVVIKAIADQYEPAEFPHRKIVLKLIDNIKDERLSAYFHTDKGTLCQGCHHNSPISPKPPKCVNCHGKAFDANTMFRPGLKAAYHNQCMGCHKAMQLEKPIDTACVECHKERKK